MSLLSTILNKNTGKVDAYATVQVLDGLGGELRRGKSTTRIIRQTTNPVWNEELSLPLALGQGQDTFHVYVTVHDNDRLGSAEKIGGFYVRYSLKDLKDNSDMWYALHDLHPSYGKAKSAVSRYWEETAPLLMYQSGLDAPVAGLDLSLDDQFLCTVVGPNIAASDNSARLEVWNLMMDLQGISELRDGAYYGVRQNFSTGFILNTNILLGRDAGGQGYRRKKSSISRAAGIVDATDKGVYSPLYQKELPMSQASHALFHGPSEILVAGLLIQRLPDASLENDYDHPGHRRSSTMSSSRRRRSALSLAGAGLHPESRRNSNTSPTERQAGPVNPPRVTSRESSRSSLQHIHEVNVPVISISVDDECETHTIREAESADSVDIEHNRAAIAGSGKKTYVLARCISFGAAIFWIHHKVYQSTAPRQRKPNGPKTLDGEEALFYLTKHDGYASLLWRINFMSGAGVWHVRNKLGQVPYLLAVQQGDKRAVEVTSDHNKLQSVVDYAGRGAVYYCMQSPGFAPVYLSRLRRKSWYNLRDTLDLTPVHFVVLRGHPKVVEHVVLHVLATLQPDVQRETFDALDPLGRSVLVMLTTKYPELAAKVLDKYGTMKNTEEVVLASGETVIRSKKTYNFWLVDHYKDGNVCTVNNRQTVIEEIIYLNRISLVAHPIIIKLIDAKWKRYRWVFVAQFLLQALIIGFIWTLVIFQTVDDHSSSQSMTDLIAWGRIAATTACFIDLFWKVYEPTAAYLINTYHRKQRRKFLSLVQLRSVTYVVYYIIFIFWQLAPSDGMTSMAGHAVIGMLLGINLLSHFTLIPKIGPIVLTVLNMPSVFLVWACFFFVVFAGFSVTMFAVINYRHKDQYFTNVGRSAESLWVSTFGIGDVWEALDRNDELLAKIVYYFYLIMAPLILINIFIAMTNDVYTTIYSDKERNWQMERATRLSQMENSIPVFVRRRLFIQPPVLVHSRNVNDLEAETAP